MRKITFLFLLPFLVVLSSCSFTPPKNGRFHIPGLENKVQVYKDKWGIPHIVAKSELDAMKAFGFIAATDRLFQMDLLRRIANGQLSEVLGKEALKHDILLRKLRLRKTMDTFWAKNKSKLDKKMISLMEAYFEGVHTYMATQPLPLEFKILGYKPRPFKIEESLAVSGYIALSFAEGIISDSLHSVLKEKLPNLNIDQLWLREKSHQAARKLTADNKYDASGTLESFSNFRDYFSPSLGLFHGSNSWVVSSKRSQSGSPLLANDPHIAFSNPSVWYEAHIKTPGFELYGHYLPLVPFAALGQNKKRAWAITMAEVDDLDLYVEKLNPKDPSLVMYKNKWVKIKEEKEIIKIRKEDDYPITVRRTPHGPIIDDTKYQVSGKVLSMKWSFHHPDNDVATTFYELSHIKEMYQLPDALAHAAAPGFNISWADAKGNIGWHVMSKIPVRPKNVSGTQLLEGWHGKHEYLRYLKIEENPHLYNPKSGIIVTANYKPQVKGPINWEGYWQPSGRYYRISELLDQKEKWSAEDFKEIQNDNYSYVFPKFLPIMLNSLTKKTRDSYPHVLKLLRLWDGHSTKQSKASSIFHMWTLNIGRGLLEDELGAENYKSFTKVADFWHFLKHAMAHPQLAWWDDVRTKQRESRENIIEKSFLSSIHLLEEKLGKNQDNWDWGNLHQVTFEHPLGKVSALSWIFNIGPSPAPGGSFQVNNMGSKRYDLDFKVTLGPSTRRIIDFSRPEQSIGILPTGNSGVPFDEHFDDQVKLFLDGKYRKQRLDIEEVKNLKHQHYEFY